MTKLRPEPAYWILAGGRGLCLSMISTASMVYQIHRVGLNPLQLVLVGTTLELSVFLFEVPTGVVADVYSRRLSIIIGMFLIGLGFIVQGSLPVFTANSALSWAWNQFQKRPSDFCPQSEEARSKLAGSRARVLGARIMKVLLDVRPSRVGR